MRKLTTLTEIHDLRSVWKNEARDFTPWLAEDENLALLSDAIGLDITLEETESSVGSFKSDMYGYETGTDRKIVIENQIEPTNHEHLGKIITYAAGKDADIVIWVVRQAREEHKAAVEWLNNRTDDKLGFFLCEVKLYQIGDSDIAVKFEVVEKPNDWTKEIKKTAASNPARQDRYEYWVAFNEYAFNDKLFANNFKKRKANTDHWMNFSIGSSACHISMSQIRQRNELVVELYIDNDKELFNTLYEKRNEIEGVAGISMDWRELPDRKASRIVVSKHVNFTNEENWNEQFEWLVSTAIAMKKGFKKHL